MDKIPNLLKLVCICVLFIVAVFVLQPSSFIFGILTGILVGVAFIIGYNDGTDNMWKIIIEVQRQIEMEVDDGK